MENQEENQEEVEQEETEEKKEPKVINTIIQIRTSTEKNTPDD
tara:strand:- start:520 stop:648 length:129 start_codon:yes stop_codon:yes gene_type:complete